MTEMIQTPKLSFGNISGLTFQAGEVLQGIVSEVLSAKLVLIQIKNRLIQAKTETPLRAGERLRFEVLSTDGEIRLKRLPEPGSENTRALLLKGLSALGARSEGLEPLRQLHARVGQFPEEIFQKFPYLKDLDQLFKQFNEVFSGHLKTFFEASGLFFEAKVNRLLLQDEVGEEGDGDLVHEKFKKLVQGDLKGLLLKIKGSLASKPALAAFLKKGGDAPALLKEIDAVLHEITYQQFESKLKAGLQMFLPLVWRGVQEGRVVFRRSQQDVPDASGQSSCACSIHLNLEKLGKLTAHIQMHSDRFYAQLIAENAGFVSVLDAGRDRLKNRFQAAGLKWGDISVRHQPEMDFEAPVSEGVDLKA